MKDLTIWLTYHDDKQIQEFRMKETNTIRLFKGDGVAIESDNINHHIPENKVTVIVGSNGCGNSTLLK